jgi:putative heme-binding domain-containing protein
MTLRRVTAALCLLSVAAIGAPSARAGDDYPERAADEIVVEAVLRLERFDLNSSEKAKAAVRRFVQHNPGSPQFFELVRKFRLREAAPLLMKLAIERSADTEGVESARLLLTQYGESVIAGALASDGETTENLVAAMGLTGEAEVVKWLMPLVTNAERSAAIRTAAVRAAGRHPQGERELLKLVTAGELSDELKFAAANILHASADASIRDAAAKLLPLPAAANAEPLPPLAELIKMTGDAVRGREVFRTVGTCANCHTVAGEGKQVGPDLTEIGSKLSREAMFVSILDPSAGISHNFETYQAVLDSGTFLSGVKLSETDEAVTLKSAEAIVRTLPRDSIEDLTKLTISLMPADLQKAMTVEQLVDVVEYLMTLKSRTKDGAVNNSSADGESS